MKVLFAAIFGVLIALSFVAWSILPRPAADGKLPLNWVSDDNPARRKQIELFNQLHPKYRLMLDPNNQGMEKVIVQSQAGTGPDLFDCYSGDNLTAFVRSGTAWDITDELKKRHIDMAGDIWPTCLPLVVLDGHVYGCPTNTAANAVWLNKTLFEKAGVPLPKGPWTWKDFLPIAQKMTVRDASGRTTQFGFLLDWYSWPQFVYQCGGRIYSPNGTRCVVDSPQAAEGLQFVHDLVYKYHVSPSPADESAATSGGWGSGTITVFGGGKGAMALGGRWWLVSMRKDHPELKLGAVEAPYNRVRVFGGTARSTLINSNSPHRSEALDFLLYMHGEAYNRLVNHQADGIAGVKKWCFIPEYMHDPQYPRDDFNAVWRDAQKVAIPDQSSPFINGQAAQRIFTKQIDLIKADQKPVAEALHDAAEQINTIIAKNIAVDPALRARYDKTVREVGP